MALKKKLQDPKQLVFGTCCINPSPSILLPTINSNLDFVFIDTEHISLNREQVSFLCKSFYFANVSPIVRIPDHDPYKITMMIDAGAIGLVAPYIETVEQVVKLVGAAKLRPLKGNKLEAILLKLQETVSLKPTNKKIDLYDDIVNAVIDDNFVTSKYLKQKNEDICLFINIESTPAIENLDKLLSIPGVDGVFIGPSDLSVQLGVPRQWGSKLLLSTIENIIKKTRKHNLSIGCHWSFENSIENQYKWVTDCGMNMIIHSSDMVLYNKMLNNDMNKLKGMLSQTKNDVEANYIFTPSVESSSSNNNNNNNTKKKMEDDV